MYYINPTGPYHGNPMGQPFPGCVMLPDDLLSDYLAAMGFVTLTLDGNTVTALAIDQEALDAYKAEHPDTGEEPEEPVTLDSLKAENKLLKAQIQAQADRADFVEDCIAEMAGVVYATDTTT